MQTNGNTVFSIIEQTICNCHFKVVRFGITITQAFLLRLGGADCARGVKLLCAAQKLLAGIFSNFMTFPDFYSSQSWFNF